MSIFLENVTHHWNQRSEFETEMCNSFNSQSVLQSPSDSTPTRRGENKKLKSFHKMSSNIFGITPKNDKQTDGREEIKTPVRCYTNNLEKKSLENCHRKTEKVEMVQTCDNDKDLLTQIRERKLGDNTNFRDC